MMTRKSIGATLAQYIVAGFAAALLLPAAVTAQKAPAAAGQERIVSLGGDATEILYALGLQDRIVAVDTTSLEPPEALKTKPNVGYMRQLSAEGVLSTGATIVVANAQAGPPEVVTALRSANLKYLALPGNEMSENIAEKVMVIGKEFHVEPQATVLAKKIDDGFSALAEQRKKVGKPVRAIFILGVNGGRAMVGGKDTTADSMIQLAGGINAAAEINGYKSLTDEALLSLAPDAVITMRREGATDSMTLIGSLPGFKESPAGKQSRLLEMEGNYLLGFGPRTPQAARELMTWFYPELAAR